MPLSLIYSDSFQGDQDLCNILAALQFRGCPASSNRDPRSVGAQAVITHVCNEAPAGNRSMSALSMKTAIKPPPAIPGASDGVDSIPLGDATEFRGTRAHSRDAPGIETVRAAKTTQPDYTQPVYTQPVYTQPEAIFARHEVERPPLPDVYMLAQRNPEAFPRERRERRGRCEAYVVFEGLAPGIYGSWEEVEPLVKRVPGNVYQGFVCRREAERAYILAFAMGALRILPARDAIGQQVPAPAIPMPDALMDAFASASDDFLGAEWHVVFKGRRPGVYPAWNFAATQTKGVSNAIFSKFPSKADAEEAYRQAIREGYVEVV